MGWIESNMLEFVELVSNGALSRGQIEQYAQLNRVDIVEIAEELELRCIACDWSEETQRERMELALVVLQDVAKEQQCDKLPDVLTTAVALRVLDKAVRAGYIDNDYRLTDRLKTNVEIVYLAHKLGEAMDIGHRRWKPFEDLWGDFSYAKVYSKIASGESKPRARENIDALFR